MSGNGIRSDGTDSARNLSDAVSAIMADEAAEISTCADGYPESLLSFFPLTLILGAWYLGVRAKKNHSGAGDVRFPTVAPTGSVYCRFPQAGGRVVVCMASVDAASKVYPSKL